MTIPKSITLEIYEVARAMRLLFDNRARALGFTQGQWSVLAHLSRNEGISQAGLAEIVEMQPISVARVLDRLEGNGLIERRPDPNDRRATQLYLTPAALPTIEILRGISEELRVIVTSGLSEAEQETLKVVVDRIRLSLEESNQQSTAARALRPR